jgi:serine/threonine protein kinase
MPQETPSDLEQITSKRGLTALCEVEDYETGAVLRTTFTFVDAQHTAWFGQIAGIRKYDLTVEQARQSLRRIPDETVYPAITPGLTVIPGDSDIASYYIKRPQFLCLDDEEETKMLPKMLAAEANVLEALKPHPHRNIVQYHGCITARGRLVGLALEKHDIILQYRFRDDARGLDVLACMRGLRAGIEHLHSLGYAHNDLNPMNVAMDKDDAPVILDFGSCRRFGEMLLSGGTPGWIDEDFSTSAAHQDLSALQKMEVWLGERQVERKMLSEVSPDGTG